MPDLRTSWDYNLSEVSEDKRTLRTGATASGVCWELLGIDGSVEGALSPFPGFIGTGTAGAIRQLSGSAFGGSETLNKGDFFHVNFSVGSDEAVNGYVYRTISGSNWKVRVDYYRAATWTTQTIWSDTAFTGTPPQMDVVVFGRFVYIFVAGLEPRMFYVETGGTFRLVTDTGPGAPPVLQEARVTTPTIGTLQPPSDSTANARVFIPYLPGSPPTSSPPESLIGPNLFSGGSPKQTSVGGDPTRTQVRSLGVGSYVMAYQLANSITGRKSQLSTVAALNTEDFNGLDSSYVLLEMVYRATNSGVTVWDQAYIYRSVKTEDAGGTSTAAILGLDKIITLSDYHTTGSTSQPINTDYKRAVYYYEADDKQLVYTDLYLDRVKFDNDMPFGGAAYLYNSMMLVSTVRGAVGPTNSVGEIRYSSTQEISPELFPPTSRVVPARKSEEVIRFLPLGRFCIGLSTSAQQLVLKRGSSVSVTRMNGGYGITGPRSAVSLADEVYLVTAKGIKMVDASTALNAVQAVDSLIIGPWTSTLSNVMVAHDETMGTLLFLNPDLQYGHLACFWTNTSKVTEAHDCWFWGLTSGRIPESTSTQERAIFATPKGEVMVIDRLLAKNGPSATARYTMLPFTGSSLFNPTINLSSATSVILAGSGTVGSDLVGRVVYVATGTNAGARAQITAVNTGTRTLTLDTGLTCLATDYLAISPVHTRIIGWQLGLVDEDGNSLNNQFRVRSAESLGCHFLGVTGPQASHAANSFQAAIFRGNDSNPSRTARPRKTDNTEYASVQNGVTTNPASFTDTDREGSLGVHGSSLFPAIETFCPDVWFQIVAFKVYGRILQSDRTAQAQ